MLHRLARREARRPRARRASLRVSGVISVSVCVCAARAVLTRLSRAPTMCPLTVEKDDLDSIVQELETVTVTPASKTAGTSRCTALLALVDASPHVSIV